MGRKPMGKLCIECGTKPRHVFKSGIVDGRCYECMRNRRRDQAAAQVASGYARATIDDDFLLLAAFPEPEKFLKMVRDISEKEHVDRRTVEHRGRNTAGPLGRAKLAGQ